MPLQGHPVGGVLEEGGSQTGAWRPPSTAAAGPASGVPPQPNLDPIQLLSLRQARPLKGPQRKPGICAGLASPLSHWDLVFAKAAKELSKELALKLGAGEGGEGAGLTSGPGKGGRKGWLLAFSAACVSLWVLELVCT